MKIIRLAICGAHGRMGRRIVALARDDERFAPIIEIDRGTDSDVSDIDAIIDFSSPEGTYDAATLARDHGAALVVGTTAIPTKTLDFLGDVADSCPVMIAPNTSLGVAVLTRLVVEAARRLGDEFDIDLIDVHHAAKRDAPSGTACRILETLERETGRHIDDDRVHCQRAGDVIGDHTITFSGPSEQISIAHRAGSRDLFARGALRAAAWLTGRAPGLYTIEDSIADSA